MRGLQREGGGEREREYKDTYVKNMGRYYIDRKI
jgi:hypothetical protein